MKKKLAALAAAGAILLSAATVFAGKPDNTPNNGKSHSKATGSAALLTGSRGLGRNVEFNAHETEPAKGQVHWWRIFADSSRSDFYANVTYVVMASNYAYMEGEVYDSTFSNIDSGDTFWLKVWDNSTPGADEDTPDSAEWKWTSGLSGHQTYEVLEGNFVVHYSTE